MTRKKLTLQNIAIIVAIATTVLTVAGKWYYMTFEIEKINADIDFIMDILLKM